MPVFIAELINQYLITEAPGAIAYACARYGEKDEPEFDVVRPKLRLGMEIKLYHGPAVMTPDRIITAANDLSKQLAQYLQSGRFVRVLYVSNLEQSVANDVLQQARVICEGISVEAIGGSMQAIIALCQRLSDEINTMVGDGFAKRVAASQRANETKEQAPESAAHTCEVDVDDSACEK